MALEKSDRRITAIVPAFNEAKRIAPVLEALLKCDFFSEIIVIDDGSTDNTEAVARQFPVRYIKQPTNLGKGKAMDRGVQEAKGDIIFFCDADIKGFTPKIIASLVEPVVNGEVEMCLGMLSRRSYAWRFILVFVPLISGQRALTKELWLKLPEYYKEKFRIEAGLNFYAKYYGKGFRFKVIRALRHTVKEKKYGWKKGLHARARMFQDYFMAFLKLQFTDIPKTLLNRRIFLASYLVTFAAMGVGIFLFIATLYGPRQFIYDVFARELRSGDGTPILQFLLYMFSIVSIEVLFLVSGLMIVLNGLILLLNIKKAIVFIKDYYDRYTISVLAPERIHKKNIQGDKRG